MNKRRGMAIIVILFMAFAIGIILAVMVKSNSNLVLQNKTTLRNLQAYYLAQSGVQHTLLKLRLLPKECYQQIESGLDNDFFDVSSEDHAALGLSPATDGNYDLFTGDPGENQSPYRGMYELTDLSLKSLVKGMKFAMDGYDLTVKSEVQPLFPRNPAVKFTDEIKEEVLLSRFTAARAP